MAKIKELSGLIHSKFASEGAFAEAIGCSRQRLSRIINGHQEPDMTDIVAMGNALDQSPVIIAQIFLRSMSPNGQLTEETEI